jgi:hypothetical protein
MNIHIIKEADGNGIVAVYASTQLSPARLEQVIEKAIDAAMDAEDLDTFAFVDRYLEDNDYPNTFRVQHADVEHHSHAFTVSEY